MQTELYTLQQKQAFIATFVEALNGHPLNDGRENNRHFRFLWRFGDVSAWFRVGAGRIVEFELQPAIERSWDFSIAAPDRVWREFLSEKPSAPYHHLFAMWAREPSFCLDGNREVMAQNAVLLSYMMRIARELWNSSKNKTEAHKFSHRNPGKESINASYWRIPINGEICRVYVEEAGQGHDLLLLHTAGSDSRQFYHLLNDERLTSGWRMVAFDLPGHGKTLPPASWSSKEYRLTGEAYVNAVLSVYHAIGLKRPVVLGCSMAGAICLKLAQSHPTLFSGVIACEAADRIPGRLNHWLKHPRVDSAEFGPQWVDGLMSPYTLEQYRHEILWEYSQAATGIFFGDVAFYSDEFQMSPIELASMDTNTCPVYMLTGAYDYSCTPEMSRLTAEKIPGAHFTEMNELGHFPMSENPDAFMTYLHPILKEIRQGIAR